MVSLPLKFIDGHLFVSINDTDLLLDTGAPASFGDSSEFTIDGETFQVARSYKGLTPETLSEYVGHPTAGIIGSDIFQAFDTLFDVSDGTIFFSLKQLDLEGKAIETGSFMGVPTLEVRINGATYSMVFDTGAKISYFQDDEIARFPTAGTVADFLPAFGQFQTRTFLVDMTLGASTFTLRCGQLPELLGMALSLTGAVGVIGNQILKDRKVGFSPRRGILVFT
jgi:hypothetical protein